MTKRFVVEQHMTTTASRWVVVDTQDKHRIVASKQSKTAAQRECRDWNEFNGVPARGLAELLVIDPKRRRR